MGLIVIVVLLALPAGILLVPAFRLARAGDKRFWVVLAGTLPFSIGIGCVLWNGPPDRGPDAPTYQAGFGPGWYCVGPYGDFCCHDPRCR
jgi:hypothetical protein